MLNRVDVELSSLRLCSHFHGRLVRRGFGASEFDTYAFWLSVSYEYRLDSIEEPVKCQRSQKGLRRLRVLTVGRTTKSTLPRPQHTLAHEPTSISWCIFPRDAEGLPDALSNPQYCLFDVDYWGSLYGVTCCGVHARMVGGHPARSRRPPLLKQIYSLGIFVQSSPFCCTFGSDPRCWHLLPVDLYPTSPDHLLLFSCMLP